MTSTIIATTGLQTTWFLLISILWLGYFVLEGFDFGVGMLVRAVGKDKEGKRAVIHTIGPVWDANEVWVLTAGGATFAAFPELYATLFSAAYLALFLILFALIARGVAFEFWGKAESDGWRATWEWALILGSAIPALLWGVAWANIIAGLPTKVLDGNAEFAGTLLDFLNPYGLMGGVVTLVLFLAHGAVFLTLRTHGEVHDRAEALAKKLSPAAVAVVGIFAVWTIARQSGTDEGVQMLSAISLVAATLAALAAVFRVGTSAGQAFGATAGSILLLFIGIFIDVFPNAIVGKNGSPTLTLEAASSTPYTLKVMTVVAVIFVPIVLAYQAWTYWVFRARIGAEDFGDVRSPLDLLPKDPDKAATESS